MQHGNYVILSTLTAVVYSVHDKVDFDYVTCMRIKQVYLT